MGFRCCLGMSNSISQVFIEGLVVLTGKDDTCKREGNEYKAE